MKKLILYLLSGLIVLSGLFMSSCEDNIDPEIKELEFSRYFSPIGLQTNISNFVNLTLIWDAVKGVEGYAVEIYKDSMQFTTENLVYSAEVATNRFQYSLEGDTRYSARIKAIGNDLSESKWNGISFVTQIKSILLPFTVGDYREDYAVIRWPAGSDVDKIELNAGSTKIVHVLTTDEVAAGIAQVENLVSSTTYTAYLFNGSQRVGVRTITTLAEGLIYVSQEDDLKALLEGAEEGSSFILLPGDYIADGAQVTINNSVTIAGYGEQYKPVIHAQFELNSPKIFKLEYVELSGIKSDNSQLDHIVRINETGAVIESVIIESCYIANYNKSILAGSSSIVAEVTNFVINNSIVKNILTQAADCIDVRAGYLGNVALTKSTFINCAPDRDFLRLDDASAAFPNKITNVNIEQCTFYGVSNATNRRILYVRFGAGATGENTATSNLRVANTIFAATAGYYINVAAGLFDTNYGRVACVRNNYFNAPGFLSNSQIQLTARYDDSGTHTTHDPGFVDVENGDFTVTTEAVIINGTGDPRWIK
jgi:hypothetical protein